RPRPAPPRHADAPAPTPRPGRGPPPGSLLALAGIGAILLGGAAVLVFFRGSEAALRPDAPPRRDARFAAPDIDAVPATVPADAGDARDALPPADAGPPIDLRPPRHDAGVRAARADAREPGEPARPDASAARPTGTATLTIGAN